MSSDEPNQVKTKTQKLNCHENKQHLRCAVYHLHQQLTECNQELTIKKKLVTAVAVKNLFCGFEEKEHSLMSLSDYTKATQIYAKVVEQKVSQDMNALRGILNDRSSKSNAGMG